MAIQNTEYYAYYKAWDNANSEWKTGDVANHTLRTVLDGAETAADNVPVEVSAANCPGLYKLLLSAAEMNGNSMTADGKSSTADITLHFYPIMTERGNLATIDTVVDAVKAITDALPDAGALSSLAQDNTVAKEGADSDTLETLSDQLDGVQTTVSGISNVTRLSVALPVYMERAAGNKAIKVEVALKDENGNMEDPDDNQLALTIYNSAGTSRDAQLYKDAAFADALDAGAGTFAAYKQLERSAAGLYYFYYKLEPDAAEEELIFKFGWEESTNALYEYRSSQVVDAANDISAIKLQTDKMHFTGDDIKSTLDSEGVQVSGMDADTLDAAAVKADAVTKVQAGLATSGEVNTVDGKVDDVQTQVDKMNFTGDDIKATLDSEKVVVSSLDPAAIDAILDELVDATGATVSLRTAVKEILAATAHPGTRAGNAYAYKDKNGDTLFTLTIASGARTRS